MNAQFFRAATAQAFLEACNLLGMKVCIPEIVIDEVFGNFKEKLAEAKTALKKPTKLVKSLVDIEFPDIPVEDLSNQFQTWFLSLLKDNAVEILPYPDIVPKELVTKAYTKVKPFKATGGGHKDYLVWETIKANILGKQTSPPYIFVNHNTSDFAEKVEDGSIVLHSELAKQIGEAAPNLTYYTSLSTVFDDVLAPKLEHFNLSDIPTLLDEITDLTHGTLMAELDFRSVYGLEGLSFGGEVTIQHIGDHDISDRKLYKVGDSIVVEVSGHVEVEASGYMDKSDYYIHEEDNKDIYVSDGNWNDHVMTVSQVVNTPFVITGIYSVESESFVSQSFELPSEIEDEWPYK